MRYCFLALIPALMLLTGCDSGAGNSGGGMTRLAITTQSLPDGDVGQPYAAALNAVGGEAPYHWTITSGTLPVGLALDGNTGQITGTPLAAVTSQLTIELTDQNPFPVTTQLSLTINPAPQLVMNTVSLPAARIGTSYSFNLSASGGVAPYTWSLISGSLPNGLSLQSTGTISGTASALGNSPFSLEVADSLSNTVQRNFSIAVVDAITISTPATLPLAFAGRSYYARLDARGGLPAYQWSVVSGSLPAGLSGTVVDHGVYEISGTPTTVSANIFTVEATDTAQAPGAQLACSLDVQAPPAQFGSTLDVTTTSLPRATYEKYSEYTLRGEGGFGPYYWEVTNGSLPPGMYVDDELRTNAILRGRPHAAGEYTFEITINDMISPPGARTLTLVVEHAIEDLPQGAAGTQYQFAAQVAGGAPTMTPASSIALAGCTLDLGGGDVDIDGTPLVQGTNVFAIELDEGGFSYTRLLAWDVQPAPATLAIVTTQVPDAIRGSGYSYGATLQCEGGSGGYNWALLSGNLPPGIGGLPASGTFAALTGSASQDGVFNFTVRVTDSAQNTATAALSLTVNKPRKGDFNGDGHPDIMVGAASGICGTGLEVFFGEPAQARYGDIGVHDSDLRIVGRANQSAFGDFNGDGVADIVMVSTPDYVTGGIVSIVYGSATNTPTGIIQYTAADCLIQGYGEGLGSSLAVGDLNGDGCDDLAVGAMFATTSVTSGGRVYVFYGGAGVLYGGLDVTSADFVLDGSTAGTSQQAAGTLPVSYRATGYLGDSLLMDDFNGDGRADLVVGGTSEVFLIESPASPTYGNYQAKNICTAWFTSCDTSIWSGRLAAGDVNADGAKDLLVGGEMSYLFYGTSAAQPFSGTIDSASAGVAINNSLASNGPQLHAVGAGLVDLNNDGADEIILSNSHWFANAMYAFEGSASSPPSGTLDPNNAWLWLNFPNQASPGEFIKRCDYNDDGIDDCMFGCEGIFYANANGANASSAGAVFVIYGNNAIAGGFQPIDTAAGVKFVGRTDGTQCGNDGPAYGVSGAGG